MKRPFLLFALVFFLNHLLSAQDDTTSVLTFEKYLEIVEQHHPLSIQAGLQREKGEARLLYARGSFDPKAFTTASQKYYNEKQYYSLLDAGLKIPTWFGVELKAGYEQNQGLYLNPEHKNPAGGLWYAGISLPVGQGFFIDRRRSELLKARIYDESTKAEQQLILNELKYEAGNAYWEWFHSFYSLQIYENALEVAAERLNSVKRSAVLGDRPYIDTLEAGIQVQNRQLTVQEARLALENARARLSVYLWADGVIPLEPGEGSIPLPLDTVEVVKPDPSLLADMSELIRNHPKMQLQEYKIESLEVEERWNQEQLKPMINLNYTPLSEPVNGDPFTSLNVRNYKWGLTFNMPLFLRKERGDLRMTRLELKEARLELSSQQATMEYKARAALNTWTTSQAQIELFRETVEDYGRLLTGERTLFETGESSLFMVNSRESGYINARVKLLDLLVKNRKAELAARYAYGILNQF